MKTSSRRTLAAMLVLCALPLLWIIVPRVWRPLPEVATLPDEFIGMAHSVAWSRDDRFIAAAGPILNDNGKRQLVLRWWKRDEKRAFQTLRTGGLADEGGITALHFLSANDTKTPLRLLSLSERGVVRVWNASSGKCEQRWKPLNDEGNGAIRGVAIAPDGQRIACAEGRVDSWEEEKPPMGRVTIRDWSGRVLQAWEEKVGIVRSVAWSQQENWLAAGTSEGMVTIYDPQTKKQLQRWRMGVKNGSVSLSWPGTNRKPVVRPSYESIDTLSFVPASSLLAASNPGGQNIALRDGRSGERVAMKYQMCSGRDFTFSHDGRLIAYEGGDLRVQPTLQKTSFGDGQNLYENFRSRVTGTTIIPNSDTPFVFAPSNRQIAARGMDGAIVLWRVDQ